MACRFLFLVSLVLTTLFIALNQSLAEAASRKCKPNKQPPPEHSKEYEENKETYCKSNEYCKTKKQGTFCIQSIGTCTYETTNNCTRNEFCKAKNRGQPFCVKSKCVKCTHWSDCPNTKIKFHSCSDDGKCIREYVTNCKSDEFCSRVCAQSDNSIFDCVVPLRYCVNGSCRVCRSNSDCDSGKKCHNNFCKECTRNADCASGKVCHIKRSKCENENIYNCLTSSFCVKQKCDKYANCTYKYCAFSSYFGQKICSECIKKSDCNTSKNRKYCDKYFNTCIECLDNNDCKNTTAKFCNIDRCVSCVKKSDCPGRYNVCNHEGKCVNSLG